MADDDRVAEELEEGRQHLGRRRGRGDHLLGDAGEDRDLPGDPVAGVHERAEGAEALAAAQLHGADLGDAAVVGGAARGLDVDHAERDLVQRGAEVVEAALHALTVPNRRSRNKCSWTRRADILGDVPDQTRYRCTTCGNLTRFDVTTSRRTRAFHHYTVGGELAVEDEQVLERSGRVGRVPLVRAGGRGRRARRRGGRFGRSGAGRGLSRVRRRGGAVGDGPGRGAGGDGQIEARPVAGGSRPASRARAGPRGGPGRPGRGAADAAADRPASCCSPSPAPARRPGPRCDGWSTPTSRSEPGSPSAADPDTIGRGPWLWLTDPRGGRSSWRTSSTGPRRRAAGRTPSPGEVAALRRSAHRRRAGGPAPRGGR